MAQNKEERETGDINGYCDTRTKNTCWF